MDVGCEAGRKAGNAVVEELVSGDGYPLGVSGTIEYFCKYDSKA